MSTEPKTSSSIQQNKSNETLAPTKNDRLDALRAAVVAAQEADKPARQALLDAQKARGKTKKALDEALRAFAAGSGL